MSEDRTIQLEVSVNSLLFHNPETMINLYFVLDDERDHDRIARFLDASASRNFNAYFIPLPLFLKGVVSSLDFSGIWLSFRTMYKLFPDNLFPVNELLIVDIATLFLVDITRRYREEIEAMHEKDQLLRFAPEMGTTYDDDTEIPYNSSDSNLTAQWIGLNTGVGFYNLSKMRQVRWNEVVTRVFAKTPKDRLPLFNKWADQNWYNSILGKKFYGSVGYLSPDWNTQLNSLDSKVLLYIKSRADSIIVLHGNGRVFTTNHSVTQHIWCTYAQPAFYRVEDPARVLPTYCRHPNAAYAAVRNDRRAIVKFLKSLE